MHTIEKYPDGVFNWVDLSARDQAAAKAFYSGLFGWEADDRPIDGGGVYTMMRIDGHSVAGIGEQQPEMKAQGMPAYWTAYVKYDDVDSVAGRVAGAGGTLIMPPMDVMSEGRMAIIQDPAGAMVGLWQPGAHQGAGTVNSPNTLVWTELQTTDKDSSRDFYGKVFGWTFEEDQNGYVGCSANNRMQAGMMQIEESWGPVPPNWAVYFLVDDVAATAARAEELGGNVVVPMSRMGEMGDFAVIADPQGGMFTVARFDVPVDEPPTA